MAEKSSRSISGPSNLPENWREAEKRPARVNFGLAGELTVLVIADHADLADFSNRVHDQLASHVAAQGAEMDVTQDELMRYFATAIITRVRHVSGRNVPDYRVNDRWALPYPMAYIVNAIGVVDFETPSVTLRPQIAAGAESLLLTREEWERVTARMLSYEPLGLRFARAIESKRDGVARVMGLYILDTGTDDTQFLSNQAFWVTDAVTAMVAGLRHDVPTEVATTAFAHPLWAPPYYMAKREIVSFLFGMSSIVSARAAS